MNVLAMEAFIARGKPAEYGQEIVRRRCRLTRARVPLAGKTILDFGCGNGAQTVELLTAGCSIVAVDIDRGDLERLSLFIKEREIENILPVQYEGTTLPIADNSVDVVVSYEVLEHVRSESHALNEIHRVLKAGGELVMSVPNKAWVFETHGADLPLVPWNRVPFFSWLPKAIHRRYAKARIYRRSEIVRLLASHAFDVVRATYITAPMDVVQYPLLQRLLRKTIFSGDTTIIPFLATAILIHARRKD